MVNGVVTTALAGIFVMAVAALAGEEYVLGPDSQVQPGVPKGEVTKYSWTSTIFPGTVRDYWVYVPKQYDPAKPAAVMVFQDGAAYIKEDGNSRVPTVFDNLIHKGEMPVTVGIFINPGVVPALSESVLPRFNRSFEYDGLGDRYARFLLEEILPEVGKTVKLAQDGNNRAIAGASSGAICAFTAAWERPDAFRRVFSTIGTYVGLRGGHAYLDPRAQDRAQAAAGLSTGRLERPQHLRGRLVDGQPGDAPFAGVRRLRREPRVG